MQIFVKKFDGKNIALEVEANDTIRNVEAKILDQTGFGPETYSLTFGGNELDPDKTLADYNIQKESTLSMIEPEAQSASEPLCFLKGTKIHTAHGYQPIESIQIGDLVLFCSLNPEYRTTPCEPSFAKVKWVAKKKNFAGSPTAVPPVRISQHAFFHNCPSNDLYMSANHSIVVNGALIRIGELRNGTTITNVNESSDLEYFHLEFDEFGFVYANGLACESYCDVGNRKEFDNVEEYWTLYPNAPREPQEGYAYYLTSSSIDYVSNLLRERAIGLYQ